MDTDRKARRFGQDRSIHQFPPVLTGAEASELLQVPVKTLYGWRKDGQLECCSARRGKHVRFLRDRLLEWFFGTTPGRNTVKVRTTSRHRLRKHVSIYRRGVIWHARVALKGRDVRKSLKTRDHDKAEQRALSLWTQLTGRRLKRPNEQTLVSAIKAYLAFLRAERRAARTLIKYESALNKFRALAGREGLHRLDQVSVSLLDKYRSQRSSAGIAAKTLFSETVTIKQLLNFAVSRGLLRDNPLRGYKLKKPKSKPQPFWSVDQVRQILEATKESVYRDVYPVLAETGMRIAEVKFLTWEDVDLERRVLYVREKELEQGRKGSDTWKPKTGDHRAVPLTPRLVELFGRLPRRKSPWVFSRPSRITARPGFMQINDRSVLSHLKSVLKKLGLPGHVHTFRHSFISHALVRGVPEAVVRRWVGHVDDQTIRWYTHIADKESHAQIERLFEARDPSAGDRRPAPPDEPAPEFYI